MKFSEKLVKLRKDLKLSRLALAEKLGVSAGSVAAWEQGKTAPKSRETWEALAKALEVENPDFLRVEDQTFMDPAIKRIGNEGQRKAYALLEEARELFVSEDLTLDEKSACVTNAVQLFMTYVQKTGQWTPSMPSQPRNPLIFDK